MYSKFLLGRLHVDEKVFAALGRAPLDLIARHAVCEFGSISPRQFKQNMLALAEGNEIQSEYAANPTDETAGRIRVTTVSGWGKTDVVWVKYQPPKKAPNVVPF